jgi:hypothetical protein
MRTIADIGYALARNLEKGAILSMPTALRLCFIAAMAVVPVPIKGSKSGPHWRSAASGYGLSCNARENEGPVGHDRKSNGSPLAIWDPFWKGGPPDFKFLGLKLRPPPRLQQQCTSRPAALAAAREAQQPPTYQTRTEVRAR